ncbi:phage integrase central domain-containing protein [Paraburkholderia sp.]|uniref:phage integrase central domain-containing protein n=1 Tax=Paraburkholderia sp. TaxID=1926495 RepID=UPI0039E57F50
MAECGDRRTARKLSKETEEKLFRPAAERWYKRKEVAGRASSTPGKMRTYLDKDILPEIGSMMLQNITRSDCARLQARFEKRDALNVSKKARGWLREIFSQVIAEGRCEFNPASEFKTIARAAPKSGRTLTFSNPNYPNSFVRSGNQRVAVTTRQRTHELRKLTGRHTLSKSGRQAKATSERTATSIFDFEDGKKTLVEVENYN